MIFRAIFFKTIHPDPFDYLWVRSGTALALDRLARRYCVTKQEMIERLVIAEDDRVLSDIELDSPEWDAYFGTAAVTQ